MSLTYNVILSLASTAIRTMARLRREPRTKFHRFARGQIDVRRQLAQASVPIEGTKTAWLHAASLGEYAIARPLMAELRKRGYRTVLTFFSPSGYEVVAPNHPGIDEVYYLPLDTKANVRRFLDKVRPDMALFMVSEYWYNYIRELHHRGIPAYLVSAKITDRSVFMRPYGFLHRRMLRRYSHIFVLDEASQRHLAALDAENVTVTGDPLFDNAIAKSREPWTDDRIEAFVGTRKDVFVAGSVHCDRDIELVSGLVNRRPEGKYILVPHTVDAPFVSKLRDALQVPSVLLSAHNTPEELAKAPVLIVDTIGSLAYIYRYGAIAYVGGGFTPLLHSVIEATVYGLPVAFGPMIHRKVTPQQLIERGIGRIVHTPDELIAWRDEMLEPSTLESCRKKALDYVAHNANATNEIIKRITTEKSINRLIE